MSVGLSHARRPCVILSRRMQDMLVAIAKKQDEAHLTADHLEAGIKLVLDTLDQTYIDVPFAPGLVSCRCTDLMLIFHCAASGCFVTAILDSGLAD